MKVLNLFGGPGTGKSTTASDVFAEMKWNNKNAELVNEYAKEATWEGRHRILQDQLYVIAKQNRKLQRINGQVDWAVSDSPLIMSIPYTRPDYLPNHYRNFVKELWDSYENVNIFLVREKPYHAVGRSQTEAEARALDRQILDLLDENGIGYHMIAANRDARHAIMDIVNQYDS